MDQAQPATASVTIDKPFKSVINLKFLRTTYVFGVFINNIIHHNHVNKHSKNVLEIFARSFWLWLWLTEAEPVPENSRHNQFDGTCS